MGEDVKNGENGENGKNGRNGKISRSHYPLYYDALSLLCNRTPRGWGFGMGQQHQQKETRLCFCVLNSNGKCRPTKVWMNMLTSVG